MTERIVIPRTGRYFRRGPRLKWWLLDLLAAPRERAIHNALVRDLAEAVQRGEVQAVLSPPAEHTWALAALTEVEQQLVKRSTTLEKALRELVDAVRIIDVMHREPAAKGLMSAEDYRSYLSGAWLGVDEKVEQARAALQET